MAFNFEHKFLYHFNDTTEGKQGRPLVTKFSLKFLPNLFLISRNLRSAEWETPVFPLNAFTPGKFWVFLMLILYFTFSKQSHHF